MSLIRWNPFENCKSFFKAGSSAYSKRGNFSADWSPSVDIVEKDDEFLIKDELLEVKKKTL